MTTTPQIIDLGVELQRSLEACRPSGPPIVTTTDVTTTDVIPPTDLEAELRTARNLLARVNGMACVFASADVNKQTLAEIRALTDEFFGWTNLKGEQR